MSYSLSLPRILRPTLLFYPPTESRRILKTSYHQVPLGSRMSRILLAVLFVPTVALQRAVAVDFATEVQPILESACLSCHQGEDADGDLRLTSLQEALAGGLDGAAIIAGKPEESPLYTTTVLAADHEEIMPPEGPPLARRQTEILKQWIAAGAVWPMDAKLTVLPRIDFKQHIQPILEQNCLSCHQPDNAEGDYDLSTLDKASKLSDDSAALVPFHPGKSPLYTLTILTKDDDLVMPPADSGGPLDKPLTDKLRLWISQGAIWPEGVKLVPKEKTQPRESTPDTLDLVRQIRDHILKQSAGQSVQQMKDYRQKILQTGAEYHMTAIPGGEFFMGSPAEEPHRQEEEGPQTKVTVKPFWMGTYEVTWDEYEPFMSSAMERTKSGARPDYNPEKHTLVDAVSGPTAPYMEMSFGMGQSGYPAISMTQHAANKYCQWLSTQTGHFYRLPTEAEWEYACRAGTTTAYSFGDDPARLDQYAWYYDNSDEKYQKIGKKKPNAWGLYDMHGNVSEWTADQYVTDYFARLASSPANPFVKPETLYPRSVRGGNWNDDPDRLRSACRRGSDPAWKIQDPQLPKSIWYHTDARWLGFRLVRPQEVPSLEEMNFYWNSATGVR